MKISWGNIAVGVCIGFFLSGMGSVTREKDEKASRLFLVQMLAIENIEQTKGFGKSSSPIADGTHHRRRLPDSGRSRAEKVFLQA